MKLFVMKKLQSAEENIANNLVVEGISAFGGVLRIQVTEQNSISNDMNVPWVKDHIEKYGKQPNPFDVC